MLRKIIKPVEMPYYWQDLLITIPRLVCGYLLSVNFGADKFGMPWSPEDKNLGLFEIAFWFPYDVKNHGGIFEMMPDFFAWAAGFSEAVGGLFLLLGLATRPMSFLILCTMLVAVVFQYHNGGMWNTLPALGFLWVAMYTLVIGSGRFGLDYLITKKYKS